MIADLEAIKKYCVNPVDSQIAADEKPQDLEMEMTAPEDVAVIKGFRTMRAPELERLQKRDGLCDEPRRYKIRAGVLCAMMSAEIRP